MYTLKIENKRGETITLTDDPNYVALSRDIFLI